ncbi:DNA-binding response regulator [Corynebacterium sp. 13CS0277]|uniref:response regulator transcription factor n=1 Tax=Corynebacterium sp. 13CS0277 TaxID=2071994 RepID=UPI000D041694|nr:response regulator transcription factor [Corynebacterium sp. 13CS0277]PRQ11633.1 DNA-binding response regulator [Corynebacterium sp. 13CS0277]
MGSPSDTTASTATRILIVEDDTALAQAIAINLKARSYATRVATSATQALVDVSDWAPDLVLLDLGLPDTSGLGVLRGTRGWSDVPIIVVSARHEQAGKIEALDSGADDYVTKPFAMGELLARVRAALRRRSAPAGEGAAQISTHDGWLRFDLAAGAVYRDGAPVRLSPNQWDIVTYLLRHRGRMVSKLDLLHAVWGDNYNRETNYLRVYISQLRHKLERDPKNPAHILTVPGTGYRFEL